MDHYTTLGVPRDASDAQVQAAYKRAVRHLRPDKTANTSEAMTALKRARDTLCDKLARKNYDASMEDDPVLAWMVSRRPPVVVQDDMYDDPEETVEIDGAPQARRSQQNPWGKYDFEARCAREFTPDGGEEVAVDLDDLPY